MPNDELTFRVVQAQLGDRAALDYVLRTVQDPIAAHIRGITGKPDAADDVLQVVLLTIARKLSALNDPRLLRAWAWRIATREAIRAASADRRHALLHEDAADDLPDATADEPDPRLDDLADAIERLPPACGVVMRMHYLQSLKLVEIAEALEISLGTVKSRLAYGLRLLRQSQLAPH